MRQMRQATRQSGVRRQLEGCWIDDTSVEAERTASVGVRVLMEISDVGRAEKSRR
jgi:hypothetical protein